MSIKPRAGRTKSLNALINKDTSILGQVLNKATHLKHIETLLNNSLPEELGGLFRVANYQNQKLTLLTASASNLTRMRFFEAQLLYKLQQQLPELKSFEIKVRPSPPEVKKVIRKLTISMASQTKLRLLAEDINDPRLKAVLLRLGNKNND
ncbi:MAG: DUF721 domain-containing protein [Pseudomonadaceae bacterium]|nr:DUF721 domain-containing protein [Pseudomonadaceae bacterium]